MFRFTQAIIFSLLNVTFAQAADIQIPADIQLGQGMQYKLKPNDPQVLANQYLWTIKADCTIVSKGQDNFITFTVTRKQGTLNGEKLVAGDNRTMKLKHGDKMHITAISGAAVELLNIGKKDIVTECSFDF